MNATATVRKFAIDSLSLLAGLAVAVPLVVGLWLGFLLYIIKPVYPLPPLLWIVILLVSAVTLWVVGVLVSAVIMEFLRARFQREEQ